MKHYGSKDIEIITPSRSVKATPSPAQVKAIVPAVAHPRSYDQNPGGLISGIPKRWLADSQTRTLDTFSRREAAERRLIEADTARRRSLVENYRARQELAEVPQLLAAESTMRSMRRSEEIRELAHQIDLADRRRAQEIARAELDAYPTRIALINAEQKLQAQRDYGSRSYALEWEERLNEREMMLGEQRAVLAEHARRAGRNDFTLEELQAERAELSADGADTTLIDHAIERRLMQRRQVRK